MKQKSGNNPVSELRQDLISGDWVVMAKFREKRPVRPLKCPFCFPEQTQQNKPVLIIKDQQGNWLMQAIPNKFPAFTPNANSNMRSNGPFNIINGFGFHEVIFPNRHTGNLAQFNEQEIIRLLNAYQIRYIKLMNRKNIKYISIFHNYGERAGASIDHPHSQIIAIPIIDPDIQSLINVAKNYFIANKECAHCAEIEWQTKKKQYILYKNDDFIAFIPFVSKFPYQIRICPIEHKSYFERITDPEKRNLAKAISVISKKLFYALNNPPFNFFLRTSPCDGKDYSYYHYHFEIIPRLNIRAGFELGAKMEICSILPKHAAEKLRKILV